MILLCPEFLPQPSFQTRLQNIQSELDVIGQKLDVIGKELEAIKTKLVDISKKLHALQIKLESNPQEAAAKIQKWRRTTKTFRRLKEKPDALVDGIVKALTNVRGDFYTQYLSMRAADLEYHFRPLYRESKELPIPRYARDKPFCTFKKFREFVSEKKRDFGKSLYPFNSRNVKEKIECFPEFIKFLNKEYYRESEQKFSLSDAQIILWSQGLYGLEEKIYQITPIIPI